jgi:hypothetical protein
LQRRKFPAMTQMLNVTSSIALPEIDSLAGDDQPFQLQYGRTSKAEHKDGIETRLLAQLRCRYNPQVVFRPKRKFTTTGTRVRHTKELARQR